MSSFTLLLLGVGRLTGEKHNELICYDREGLGKCTSDPGKHCISVLLVGGKRQSCRSMTK